MKIQTVRYCAVFFQLLTAISLAAPESSAAPAVTNSPLSHSISKDTNKAELIPQPSTPVMPTTTNAATMAKSDAQQNLITLNFSEGADIRDVMTAFALQSGCSVVLGPDVKGEVRLHLTGVPWKQALDVILTPYGFTYKMVGNTYVVSRMDKSAAVEAVTPLVSRVFRLRYLDAFGVKDMIEKQLSPRGSMSTLISRGQKGWGYGSDKEGRADSGKRQRLQETEADRKAEQLRSRTIVVTDTPSVVEHIAELLKEVDVMPAQVLIEARFVEVSTGDLRDLGVQFGTGLGGATSPGPQPVPLGNNGNLYGVGVQQTGGGATPAAFQPSSKELTGAQPFNAGLSMLFQKLDPTQFEVLLHALEENDSLHVLSSPRILTLNNGEAAIMVGTKYPIIKTEVTGQSGSSSTTIDYWQDIGIQLNVVPQICDNNTIRMVIHPAVTAQIGTASGRTVTSSTGGGNTVPITDYPVLSTRETETQVIINSGDTLAIGGLLKNEEQETLFKVPLLGDIPLLGTLFRRKTTNKKQMDLVIFLTASVVPSEGHRLIADNKALARQSRDNRKAVAEISRLENRDMDNNLRALLELEKLRESEQNTAKGLGRIKKSEQERRLREIDRIREELIKKIQEQRDKDKTAAGK